MWRRGNAAEAPRGYLVGRAVRRRWPGGCRHAEPQRGGDDDYGAGETGGRRQAEEVEEPCSGAGGDDEQEDDRREYADLIGWREAAGAAADASHHAAGR
ncbi:MAG: hypothetical protein KGN76_07015 [Acidobacteriota bacterium]|nr:hypothetical protein [Acidobacteriota bacterium]